MKKHKKVHHEEHVDESWLLPYADLLTLLLALFIVMFAMSQVDQKKMEALSAQFKVIFSGGAGLMEKDGTSIMPQSMPPAQGPQPKADAMAGMQSSLEQKIANSGFSDQVIVTLRPEGLNISIQDVVLFQSGQATVLEGVKPLLLEISNMLSTQENAIRISGHTDDHPINTREFRSNWDLSAIRAINVMNFMVDSGKLQPEKLSIQAYGEYMPAASNETEEGRSQNRRIEILVIRSDMDPAKVEIIKPLTLE